MMGLDALAAATPRRGRSSSQQVISSVKKTIVTPFASQGTASKPWIGGDEDSEDDEEIEGKKQKSKLWS